MVSAPAPDVANYISLDGWMGTDAHFDSLGGGGYFDEKTGCEQICKMVWEFAPAARVHVAMDYEGGREVESACKVGILEREIFVVVNEGATVIVGLKYYGQLECGATETARAACG